MSFVVPKNKINLLDDKDYIHSFLKFGNQTKSKFGTRIKSNFVSYFRDYKHI